MTRVTLEGKTECRDTHAIYYPITRPVRRIVSMRLLNFLLIVAALCGFAYTFYCQTKARGNISREKFARAKDPRRALQGPLPPKTILTDEGLKYYRRYYVGMGVFAVCIIIMLLITALSP